MFRAAIVWIGLLGSMGLAGSEKWYPAQTILEPTFFPDYSAVMWDIHKDLIFLGRSSYSSESKPPLGQIYRRQGTTWTLEQELPVEAVPWFHCFVGKIQDNTCIVLGDSWNPIDWSTIVKAYAFGYDGHQWNLVQELVPPEGILGGIGLDLDSNVCVIGGIECTHVFRYDGQRWNYEQKLPGGSSPSYFGVAVSGNRIVISSPIAETMENRTGAAYFYVHDGIQWQPDGKISGLFDYAGCDFQGIRTDIDGDWCILGLPNPCSQSAPGKTYICRKTNQWKIVQVLSSTSPENGGFGDIVFLQDGICGVNDWDPQTHKDSMSLYGFNGSIWAPYGKVNLPMPDYEYVWNAADYDDGNLLVIAGTILSSPDGFFDGAVSAAVFRACPATDLTNDCRVDIADFAALAEEWMK
jgi:hypothetical protein